jgi:transcription elongation factor GreB
LSRAFVDEDAGSDETEGMHEIPLPLAPGSRNYMTVEGAERMLAELRLLSDVERPKAAAALSAAESAVKADALRRVSELDRRISYLARMKSLLEIVEVQPGGDRVAFGLTARVREPDGAERDYRIVGADESDPERGLVSWASPVARALLGKHVGETAIVKLPQGEKRLSVLEIK